MAGIAAVLVLAALSVRHLGSSVDLSDTAIRHALLALWFAVAPFPLALVLRGRTIDRVKREGWAHFRLLISEYRTLPTVEENPRAIALLDECAKRWSGEAPTGRPGWDEVHGAEIALLEVLPAHRLMARGWVLEKTYAQLCGEEFHEGTISRDAVAISPEALRDRLLVLLAEIHRMRIAERARHAALSRMLAWAIGGYYLALTPLVVAYCLFGEQLSAPVRGFLFVWGWGATGGLVSVVYRLVSRLG